MSPLSRRNLLRAGVLLPLGAAACAEDDAPANPDTTPDAGDDADLDTAPDANPTDATSPDADATTTPDTPSPDDAGPETSDAGDTEPADTSDASPDESPLFVKGPWTQIVGATAVRLLAESDDGAPLDVILTDEDGNETTVPTTAESAEITFFWPRVPLSAVGLPDRAGTFWRHEARFDDLTPGARYTWRIERDGRVREGSFRAPPASGQAFRLAWISDTMHPQGPEVAAMLATHEPDLVIHGGDIQYQSNPFDTWNGVFHYFAPLFSQAPTHFTIGNHELEDYDEYEEIWVRLLGDQGDAQFDDATHRFVYGGVLFLILNSERAFGVEGAQMDWLRDQLEAAKDDPNIRTVVPVFHRPTYSFSRYRPVLDRRELTDALFRAGDVKFVMTGHNHCYERFENEGITYIMDGGGGAGSYNPNQNIDFIEAERPTDLPLRKHFEAGQGGLIVDVNADGTMTCRRFSQQGVLQETFTVDA